MARTRVGGKQKGPRDPTKEVRIQAAIRDTLTGVHGSFRSAAIAHNVPPQTVRDQFISTAQVLPGSSNFSTIHPSSLVAGSSQLLPKVSTSMITRSSTPAPSQALIRPMSHVQVMASSKEKLWEHIQQLYAQNQTLMEVVAMQTALIDAANAHCTIAQRENQDWRVRAENERRKKTCTTTKVKVRYVTAPEFKESFEAGAGARREKEGLEEDKKKLDEEARIARIHNSITTRTFDSPFTSYKWKENLEALAGALGLSRDGKIADLSARIKAHLKDPDIRAVLADNPRFSAIYGSKRRTGRPDAIANLTSSESSTPSANTSLPTAANDMFHPQPPFFPQMQGSPSLSIMYPNRSHHVQVGPAVLSTTTPVVSQPFLFGHPNSHSSYYSGSPQYIFN
ncbi:hypothetical protein DFJ58DRAFT_765163 [Suillus subalutaceus]|uniref:uncharacterized protein n=1 Tax=Suillus subalutaceus TaxID=48586 RepID=UPI001B86CE7E|nr:uncharacterized protein DFJ58DRAFT_765163 [Suillus subalutaceus]KAG1870208.1 hypothetical protein DFJ58DRAFT_765163 [Suillus subalutaceus]